MNSLQSLVLIKDELHGKIWINFRFVKFQFFFCSKCNEINLIYYDVFRLNWKNVNADLFWSSLLWLTSRRLFRFWLKVPQNPIRSCRNPRLISGSLRYFPITELNLYRKFVDFSKTFEANQKSSWKKMDLHWVKHFFNLILRWLSFCWVIFINTDFLDNRKNFKLGYIP